MHTKSIGRHWAVGLLACALLGGAGPSVRAAEEGEEAVKIYAALRGSVVGLDNAEGSGTGVIVDTSGLVLTNAHVVSSPLPYAVKVDVRQGSAWKEVVFKKTAVVGYHTTLDLALVRIDPAELKASGVRLAPAKLATAKASPGQRVYVIGNPAAGDEILTRSITGGMLSAVDRVVEKEKYYQTDAAINPGNSGGPMCDRTGTVIGLITFKFTDAQAVGFAIPVHDISLKAFVPLERRKGDPAKAKELMALADQFGKAADRAGRAEGLESELRLRLNAYAAMCYREALLYDPANPVLFYNIGMLLRTLDEDATAAAYLARSLQLSPWDESGNGYRELGLSLVKQERAADALTVWGEGVAKYPYASKVWEDLAITAVNAKKYADAAEAASVALLISDATTQTQTMRRIVADATDAAATPVKPRAKLVARLDGLLTASNAARKAKKPFVNNAAQTLITSLGGAAPADVAARIAAKPIARLPELADLAAADDDESDTKPRPADRSDAPPAVAGGPRRSPDATDEKPHHTKPGKAKPSDADAPDDADATTDNQTPKPKRGGGWVGTDKTTPTDPKSTEGPAAPLPKAVDASDEVGDPERKVVDARVIDLSLKGVTDCLYTPDGKSLLVLIGETGEVMKIDLNGMVVRRKLDIGSKCSALGLSKSGVVVAVNGLQEIWLLDDKLDVVRSATCNGVERMAASPASAIVFASAGNGDHLYGVDMSAGKVVKDHTVQALRERRGAPQEVNGLQFRMIAFSPDGRYLFTEGSECIHRLVVRKSDVIYEEGGPRIGANPQQLVVSPDSSYVCLPSGGGNGGVEGLPRTNYATYVFGVDDLAKPVITVESGAYPRAFAFDVEHKRLLTQNHEQSLILFTPGGARGKEYKLSRGNVNTQRIIVAPGGASLVIIDEAQASWMKLPG